MINWCWGGGGGGFIAPEYIIDLKLFIIIDGWLSEKGIFHWTPQSSWFWETKLFQDGNLIDVSFDRLIINKLLVDIKHFLAGKTLVNVTFFC